MKTPTISDPTVVDHKNLAKSKYSIDILYFTNIFPRSPKLRVETFVIDLSKQDMKTDS